MPSKLEKNFVGAQKSRGGDGEKSAGKSHRQHVYVVGNNEEEYNVTGSMDEREETRGIGYQRER